MYEQLRAVVDSINAEVSEKRRFSPKVALISPRKSEDRSNFHAQMYIFLPKPETQALARSRIAQYVQENGLRMIVTKKKHCPGNYECYGHYVDPAKSGEEREHVFLNEFPDDINGTDVHMMTEDVFAQYV